MAAARKIATVRTLEMEDEEEMHNLIRPNEKKKVSKEKPQHKRYRSQKLFALIFLTLITLIMVYKEEIGAMVLGNKSEFKDENELLYEAKFRNMKSLFMERREEYHLYLKEQYGEYWEKLFAFESFNGTVIESQSSASIERAKRRMKIKILQAVHSLDITDDPVSYTWVVSGHSAAAGHGVLFNQTYAAVLESSAQPVFDALGINFKAKNKAMGAMASAPLFTMCMEEYFGLDIDFLSWDFGMLDTRAIHFFEWYAQRAGMHPTRPSIMSFDDKYQTKVHQYLEKSGMSMFRIHVTKTINVVPDSEIEDPMTLPPALQSFVCGGHFEKGGTCDENKWDTIAACPGPKVGYQVGWHHGWKYNKLTGHLLASFLVENLMDSLNELDMPEESHQQSTDRYLEDLIFELQKAEKEEEEDEEEVIPPSISDTYHKYLLSLEDKDKETFLASKLPTSDAHLNEIELANAFYRSKIVCRTAYLPSQARYDGLVTETGNSSMYLFAGKTTYQDEGYPTDGIPEPNGAEVTPIWLAYDKNMRDICEYAEIDFKDSFVVRNEDNWMSLTIPNKLEKEAFVSIDGVKPTLGIVLICEKTWDGKKPPSQLATLIDYTNNSSSPLDMVVNGVSVVGTYNYGWNCHVLENKDGYVFPSTPEGSTTGDNDGEYEIKIRVQKEGGWAYFASFYVL